MEESKSNKLARINKEKINIIIKNKLAVEKLKQVFK